MITKIEAGEEIRGELPYYCKWEESYSIIIKLDPKTKELVYFSCDCPYGSFYGKSKKNKGREICRHCIKAYSQIVKISPARARINLIKMGIMDKNHLKRI